MKVRTLMDLLLLVDPNSEVLLEGCDCINECAGVSVDPLFVGNDEKAKNKICLRAKDVHNLEDVDFAKNLTEKDVL